MENLESIMLFPTVISSAKREVDESEKDKWFSLFLKHSNKEGKSHDFLGFEGLHHEPSVEFFYRDVLMPAVEHYLESLRVNTENMDILVTKSFFNVTDQAGIRPHDHAENHISFVYYPHIAEGKERSIIFFDPRNKHPNEPYSRFFASNVKEWTPINARNMMIPVEEGILHIFPSDMEHDIEVREGDAPSGIQGFKSKQELLQTRFCVAGDMMIVRNHIREYQRMLPPHVTWKKFG